MTEDRLIEMFLSVTRAICGRSTKVFTRLLAETINATQ